MNERTFYVTDTICWICDKELKAGIEFTLADGVFPVCSDECLDKYAIVKKDVTAELRRYRRERRIAKI